MTTEIFDWGLDSIRKKYEEEDARLRAKIASIDWEAARARWAAEAAAEEEREKRRKEKRVINDALVAFEGEHWAMGMVLAEKTDLTDARLQYYMGYCYENGFGTAKDIDAAKEWYEKAATQGNEDAIKRLEKKSNNDEDADDDEDGELTEEDKRILEQIGKERIDAALRKILEEWSEQTTHKHSRLAADIKSGKIKSKSGEGYFVLKGEYYDAIEAGRKTTEYRDLTPRNLSMSIGIKTVKLQRGYGHPGQPPEQMRFEVSSVGLLDADDRECDPYNIPDGFIATTIAIHLGKRIA